MRRMSCLHVRFLQACSHLLVIRHKVMILVSSHGCCSHTHLVEGVSAERILSLCVFEPQAGGTAAAEESHCGGGVRGDGCTGVSGHHPAEPPWPCPARKASFPRPAVQVRCSWIGWQGPRLIYSHFMKPLCLIILHDSCSFFPQKCLRH